MFLRNNLLVKVFLTLFLVLTMSLPVLASPVNHNVQWGDSLWYIASDFGTSIEAIKEANGLPDNEIYAGENLVVPDTSPSGPNTAVATTATTTDRHLSEHVDLLARMIHAEAEGEPYVGKVAVAAVIINRVYDSRFPNDIHGVLFSPWEFEPVMNNRFWSVTPTAEAYAAARDALDGWDPTGGAVFFYNPAKSTSPWIFTRPVINQIGQHVFAI